MKCEMGQARWSAVSGFRVSAKDRIGVCGSVHRTEEVKDDRIHTEI